MPVRFRSTGIPQKYFYATGRRFEGACQNHGVWPCRKHIHSGGTRLCVLLSERGSLALESGGHRPHTAEFRPDNGHIRLHTLNQAAGGTAACHLLHGDNRCQGGKITWSKIWAFLTGGAVLFFLNWWLLNLPFPHEAVTSLYIMTLAAGYLCLLMAGLWISRLYKHNLMEDVFNEENESFMQETRLIENEYSVNLPTRFQYGESSTMDGSMWLTLSGQLSSLAHPVQESPMLS